MASVLLDNFANVDLGKYTVCLYSLLTDYCLVGPPVDMQINYGYLIRFLNTRFVRREFILTVNKQIY
jgi:hypothetical protein